LRLDLSLSAAAVFFFWTRTASALSQMDVPTRTS
jgi:hypothetical protein